MAPIIPVIGEIRKGREIGYASKKALFMWCACFDCGKPRWVQVNKAASIKERRSE